MEWKDDDEQIAVRKDAFNPHFKSMPNDPPISISLNQNNVLTISFTLQMTGRIACPVKVWPWRMGNYR